jgi:hypothetical protein
MIDDIFIQQLRELHYDGKVDVTQAVMAEVRKKPLLVSAPDKSRWSLKRISAVVAACVVVAVIFNFIPTYTHQVDTTQLADDIAAIYDFHAGYGDNNSYYEYYLEEALLN